MSGISRRLDQLGRIVLPKEVRKKLKLKEGSLLEIDVVEDEIVLKKSDPVKDLKDNIEEVCSVVQDCSIVCISESIIVYASKAYKNYESKTLRDGMMDSLSALSGQNLTNLCLCDDLVINNKIGYFLPLITYGDLFGYICFFYDEKPKSEQEGVMSFIAHYISSKL